MKKSCNDDGKNNSELIDMDNEAIVALGKTRKFRNFTKKQRVVFAVVFLVCLAIYLCFGVWFLLKRGEKKEAELKESVIEQAEKIEDKYGINIMWGGRSNNQHVNELMSAPNMTNDEEKIKGTLDGIESIFQKYPDGFFDELKEDKVSNMKNDFIDVYLCDSIISSNDVADVVTGGSSGFYYKCSGAYILLDVNQEKNFSHIISHEIFHIMDSQIGTVSFFNEGINDELGDSIDFRWIKCNPDGYEYLKFGNNQDEIHVFDSDLPYDINTEKIENVYFVNKYAQLSDQEDRAETFSFLIACDDADDLPESYNSPHVKEKAKLIVDMIDDTFECVDDNAYWARMYHEKYGD